MKNILILIMAVMVSVAVCAKDITVSAAASMKDVMQEIKTMYEGQSKDKIVFNFGSSGSLKKQIENGAPADVFISAAPKQMNDLEKGGYLLEGSRVNLVINDVVLIVPTDSKSKIKEFKGLKNSEIGKIAIGEPKSVPVGQYTMEILKNLGISDVTSKAVYAKDVREVLSWVETSNVDAGVVYKTDAMISKNVKIICSAPKGSHEQVLYPAAVIKGSPVADSAKDFIKFIKTPKVKAVFEKYGFTPAE